MSKARSTKEVLALIGPGRAVFRSALCNTVGGMLARPYGALTPPPNWGFAVAGSMMSKEVWPHGAFRNR